MSGAQVWNGTADTLKANPMTTSTTPRVMNGVESGRAIDPPMSVRSVLPDAPNSSDMP